MTDKKNEDYVVRMGDDYGKKEKDAFLARSPTRSAYGSSVHGNSLEQLEKSPPLSIVAYCFSSISMTVVNKYVVSGSFWNLNFFYLTVQVCLLCIGVRCVVLTIGLLGRCLHCYHYSVQAAGSNQGPGSL